MSLAAIDATRESGTFVGGFGTSLLGAGVIGVFFGSFWLDVAEWS